MPVRQRGNSWQADVVCKVTRKRVRKTFDSRTLAEQWENKATGRVLNGLPVEEETAGVGQSPNASPKTLGELRTRTFERFWKGTKAEYITDLNAGIVVDVLGSERALARIDSPAVDSLIMALKGRNLSNATINRKLSALSVMLNYAHDNGWMVVKPKIKKLPETEHRIRFYTPEEEDAFLAWFDRMGMVSEAEFFQTLLDTGLRLGEGLTLKWENTAGHQITVWAAESKGVTNGAIPMTDRVERLLDRRRAVCPKGEQRVFWDLARRKFQTDFNKARDACGLKDDEQAVIHTTRHTFCSRLVQAGVHLLRVKEWARHSDLTMTQRYAHLAPADRHAISVLNRVSGLNPVQPVSESPSQPVPNLPQKPSVCDTPMMRIAQ